jgi:hypothetical protein
MTSFIEPLNLQVIFTQLLAGSSDIFFALALFFIFGMGSYFRMNYLIMMFMLAIFMIMFNAYISSYMLLLIASIGGILLGYIISRIVKN